MRHRPAPAPAIPPSNKTQSTGSCSPARGRGPELAQDRCAAPHGRLRAPPGPRPRRRSPRRRSPSRHVPCQQQQVRGKDDILSSATGPSTARCSKDVTTHQHRPGARPGTPKGNTRRGWSGHLGSGIPEKPCYKAGTSIMRRGFRPRRRVESQATLWDLCRSSPDRGETEGPP